MIRLRRRGADYLDLFDNAAVAEASGLPREAILWPERDATAIEDAASAARYCIDRLRASRRIRRRFPRALSDGPSGGFARWIAAPLGPRARAAVAAAFAADLAGPVRHVLASRPDARASFPLGLLAQGRRAFIPWLFRHAMREHRLAPEAIWWFALESAENPGAELVRTYLFSPDWQRAIPDGLTVFGRADLAEWLRATHGLDIDPALWPEVIPPARQIRLAYARRDDWRRAHPRAFATQERAAELVRWTAPPDGSFDVERTARELVAGGVNVLGHLCYPSGLRSSVEALIEGLRRAGTSVAVRDVPVDPNGDEPHHVAFPDLPCYDATIVHVQPEPLFDTAFERAGLAEPRGAWRIGYWYWELDEIPDSWLAREDRVDELWVASRFVAEALKTRFRIPVFALPPGVELTPFAPLPRAHFGLSEDRFVFLFVFHAMSGMERKNPLGLIAAFRRAFGADPSVELVLKTSFGDRHPDLMRELRDAAEGSNVRVIDAVFTREATLALMDACDCYVSLHRSEGFGLTMAEAMLLGKPVIATNYSGNVDFMHTTNSLLVDYELVSLDRDLPPYPVGSRWAEPSIEHAARLMRAVRDDPDRGRELGARARAELRESLSLEAAGRRMAERLGSVFHRPIRAA
ncbi:MAG: glycosyltransferase family 4 protein [Acetobacteraceae bacterium]